MLLNGAERFILSGCKYMSLKPARVIVTYIPNKGYKMAPARLLKVLYNRYNLILITNSEYIGIGRYCGLDAYVRGNGSKQSMNAVIDSGWVPL